MELRSYLDILRRRWLAIVVLPALVLMLVVFLDRTRTPSYTAEARLSVSRISPETTEAEYEFDDYYDLLATDFIADDLVEIVRGNVFAAAVSERLAEQGIEVSPDEVSGALSTSREHRILTILSTTSDHGFSVVIANVAAVELREDITDYVGAADQELPITIRAVDVPVEADADTLQVRLTYILAVIVAGGFGLLLALLLEYLDDSIPTPSSAEAATGLSLLGVVPGDPR